VVTNRDLLLSTETPLAPIYLRFEGEAILPTGREGLEIVATGHRAGMSDSEIVEMLVEAGFTPDQAAFQLRITVTADDDREFADRLEAAGWDPDHVSWQVNRRGVWRALQSMLVDAGLDRDAAREAIDDLMRERTEQGYEFALTGLALDAHVAILIDRGVSPELAHAVCARFLDETTDWTDARIARSFQSSEQADTPPPIAQLRESRSADDAMRTLGAVGLDDLSPRPEFLLWVLPWVLWLRLSTLAVILERAREEERDREPVVGLRATALSMLTDGGYPQDQAEQTLDAYLKDKGTADDAVWVLIDRGVSTELAYAVASHYAVTLDSVTQRRIVRVLRQAGCDDPDAEVRLLRETTSPSDALTHLHEIGLSWETIDEIIPQAGVFHNTLSPLPVLLERGPPRRGLGRLFRRSRS
jgi:hypothetical protein